VLTFKKENYTVFFLDQVQCQLSSEKLCAKKMGKKSFKMLQTGLTDTRYLLSIEGSEGFLDVWYVFFKLGIHAH